MKTFNPTTEVFKQQYKIGEEVFNLSVSSTDAQKISDLLGDKGNKVNKLDSKVEQEVKQLLFGDNLGPLTELLDRWNLDQFTIMVISDFLKEILKTRQALTSGLKKA